jgi:hypothetical protein
VLYTAATKSIQVINDNGIGWGTAGTLGPAGTLQNSQCSVDLATSSASGTGTSLTLNLALSFKPAFIGAKNFYMWAFNKFNLASGYQQRGTWTIPAVASTLVSVTPNAGSGTTQLFQLVYSDPTGFASITSTRTLIGTNTSGVNACGVLFTAGTKSIQVINDNGVGWGTAGTLGATGTLQNSQCAIDLATSSASGVGSTLTLNLAVSFKPAFAGAKNFYMWAFNKFNLTSGYQQRGTWTVPAAAPLALSVTPSAGSGTSQLFQFNYSDAAGFAAITQTRALIGTNLSGINACAVLYTPSTQQIQVINDNSDSANGLEQLT